MKVVINLEDFSTETLVAIAKEAHNPQLLNKLENHINWRIRRSVAENPNTSKSSLDRLADDPHGEVRVAVAQNSSTSTATLDKLSTDDYWLVVRAVVVSPFTSPSTLRKLASNAEGGLRSTARAMLEQREG